MMEKEISLLRKEICSEIQVIRNNIDSLKNSIDEIRNSIDEIRNSISYHHAINNLARDGQAFREGYDLAKSLSDKEARKNGERNRSSRS